MSITVAGTFVTASGPVNGATVYAWAASRFSGVPAENQAAPSGTADAGPVTTGETWGGDGQWQLSVPNDVPYYIQVVYGSNIYWQLFNPTTLAAAAVEALFTASGQIFFGTGSAAGELINLLSALYTQFTAGGQLIVGTGSGAGELLAAGTSGQVLTSNGAGSAPSWAASGLTLISKQTLASTTTSVTFSSIPSTYNHLLLIAAARSAGGTYYDKFLVQLNGDTSAHYDVAGSATWGGNSPAASEQIGLSALQFANTTYGDMAGVSASAGVAGRLRLEIPDYAGTTFEKVLGWESGYFDGAVGGGAQGSARNDCSWRSTAAVSSLKVYTSSGSGFVAGSELCLYGVM